MKVSETGVTGAPGARSARRGFTIIEMMLVVGLFCVVGTMVTELFINSSNLYTRAEARLDRQASALISLGTLTREMRASAYQTLTVTDQSQGAIACSFRRTPVAQIRPDGGINTFVIFWHDPKRRALCRTEVTRDATYQRLTPVALLTCVTKAGPTHQVASSVRTLSITLTGGDGSGIELSSYPSALLRNPNLKLTVTLTSSTASTPSSDDEVYTTSVGMRNKL